MIFGGSNTIWSKRQHKVRYREACTAETAIPSFLSWSESPITFDQRDHPSYVARPGRYSLIVDSFELPQLEESSTPTVPDCNKTNLLDGLPPAQGNQGSGC